MPADHLVVEFHDGDVFPEALVPSRVAVDITDFEVQMPPNQRQEFLDQDFAQVAPLATVDDYCPHLPGCSGAPPRYSRRHLLQAFPASQPDPGDGDADTTAEQRRDNRLQVVEAREIGTTGGQEHGQ